MKKTILAAPIAYILVLAMMLSTCTIAASAAEGSSGKYVKDVFIAYGEKKEQAEQWLRDNGWEPFEDLNDGKSSKAKTNAVAVMGIKRTNDPNEAITDMAAMNMKGGYSFDDYEKLVEQKKADITEFINTFIPALNEYRDNYNGKGSAGGKKRAQMAHDLLNKFYDGDPNDENAINDTGKPLGDLLLNKTKTEIGDSAYNALSKDQKMNTADLQQIILESTGAAVDIVERSLALATDTSETSWLDRLSGLTGDKLVENIAEFAPEAAGQDLAPSAAMSLLSAHFEDYSKILAAQWICVHEDILWYENYCTENDLWPKDDEIISSNVTGYFEALLKEDENRYQKEYSRFDLVNTYYIIIKTIPYSGAWGKTLYDFFKPKDEGADYSEEYSYFAPLAAALSNGQRAALEFMTLPTLMKLGVDSESIVEADFPPISENFRNKEGKELEAISIYSGINRSIFRKGVALTNDALAQKNLGRDPYEQIWDEGGIVDIVSYTTFGLGAISMTAGIGMAVRAAVVIHPASTAQTAAQTALKDAIYQVKNAQNMFKTRFETFQGAFRRALESPTGFNKNMSNVAERLANDAFDKLEEAQQQADAAARNAAEKASAKASAEAGVSKLSTAGKWMMGIGGALMIMAAILKGVQIYKYYNRTFTKIPTMIVDEADIVTNVTDENGNTSKKVDFLDFVYYEVVKCNRQEIGIHTSAQKGVADYKSWGCGDAADLGADVGKQWLAIYVNRSRLKGNPILADSLKLQKGSAAMPSDCNACLHIFLYKNPVKIDHKDYCFRQDNDGMYLFWKGDEAATTTASTFSAGYIALAAIGGLAVGIVGTTIVMLAGKNKKKKKEEPTEETA